LSGWNISSVVQKIILRTYVPTMMVRAYQPGTDDLGHLRYRRLLVPLDGSQRAECALPPATVLARSHDSRLLAHRARRPEMPRHVPLTDEETEMLDRITERNRLAAAQYLEQLQSRLSGAVETRLDVIFVEAGEPSRSFGAKSVSEIAIDGVALDGLPEEHVHCADLTVSTLQNAIVNWCAVHKT
jgi:nucleotide-binding universal stress UspA family protein